MSNLQKFDELSEKLGLSFDREENGFFVMVDKDGKEFIFVDDNFVAYDPENLPEVEEEEEKPSVTISTDDWHFKLIGYVLGSNAPTPENMHNLCPYFWLLVFAVLVSPFVWIVRNVIGLVGAIDNFIDERLKIPMKRIAARKWEKGLTDDKAWRILDDGEWWSFDGGWKYDFNEYIGTAKDAAIRYMKRVHGIDKFVTAKGNPTKKWAAFVKEQSERWEEIKEKIREKDRLAQIRKRAYEDKMEGFRTSVDKGFNNVADTVASWKTIIKWTKRFVGLVITLAGLVALYFVVGFLSWILLSIASVFTLTNIITAILIIVGVGIVALLVYVVVLWVQYMQEKGTKLWYIKAIYLFLKWVIVEPLKFLWEIFIYKFIWMLIIENIILFVKSASLRTWKGILGVLGIFGEYGGAAYTDYCPGLTIEDKEKQ